MTETPRYNKQVGVMVDIDTYDKLCLEALRKHVKPSTLARMIITNWVDQQDVSPTRPKPLSSLFSEGD